MTVLEFVGVAFILFVIWLIGYAVGYHIGYDDGESGRPKDWTKTRKPPSAVGQKKGG